IDPRLVDSEVRRASLPARPKPGQALVKPAATKRLTSEEHVLALYLRYRALVRDAFADLQSEELTDSRNRELLNLLVDRTIPDLDPDQLVAGMDDVLADYAERLLEAESGKPSLLPATVRRDAENALQRMRLERVRLQQRQISAAIKEAQSSGEI